MNINDALLIVHLGRRVVQSQDMAESQYLQRHMANVELSFDKPFHDILKQAEDFINNYKGN